MAVRCTVEPYDGKYAMTLKPMKSVVLVLALALAMLSILSFPPAAAAAAAAAPNPSFGIATHLLWGLPPAVQDRELDAVRDSGAGWVRIDLGWNGLEPSPGHYDPEVLASLDHVVTAARARGIRVLVVVLATPSWANGGAGKWAPPTGDEGFRRTMAFLSARYAGRVGAWEIGNEINETGFWAVPRADSARRYASLLRAGFAGVRSGDPGALVVSAGLAGSDHRYLQELYDAGAGGSFDCLGVHPYTRGRSPWYDDPEDPGSTLGGLAAMRSTMVRNGDAEKSLWVTELGWRSDGELTPELQASYLGGGYQRILSGFPGIGVVFTYCLRDRPGMPYGLLSSGFIPKPSWYAYRRASGTPVRPLLALSASGSRARGTRLVLRTGATGPRTVTLQSRRPGGRWTYVSKASLGGWQSCVRKTAYRAGTRYRTVSGKYASATVFVP